MPPSPQPAYTLLALSAILAFAACATRRADGIATIDNRRREDVLLSNWKPLAGQKCTVAASPRVLPSVESLLDTAAMPSYLVQSGVGAASGSTLFSIKFDSSGTPTRVRAIESTLIDQASDMLQMAVASALLPQPPGGEWGVRLRIDIGPTVVYRIGRSEVCAPTPIEVPGDRGTLAPSNIDATLAPGNSADRVIAKRVREVRFNVLVGADGTVLAAKLVAPVENSAVADAMQTLVLAERWSPGLDDRVPVPMSALRTPRITTETHIRRVF